MEKLEGKELRKLQMIQLDLLLEVDKICRENNIKYVLSDGTLLGAMRHGGFIPWDDDLDISMTRAEFIKFEEVCKHQLDDSKFFLQTSNSDKEYRWGYAKVRRRGTEYIRKGQEMIKCFSAVSMDIFIFDNVPDNKVGRFLYHYTRRICIKTLYSVIGAVKEKVVWKRIIYKILKNVRKEVPLKVMEILGNISNRKKTEMMYCMSFYRVDKFGLYKKYLHRAVESKWFDELTEIEFEGFNFYTFKNYKDYLAGNYKNCWEYPPDDQRFIHPPLSYSFNVSISLRGRDVNEYMNKKPLFKKKEEEDLCKH